MDAGPRRGAAPAAPERDRGVTDDEIPDTTAAGLPGAETLAAKSPGADSLLALTRGAPSIGAEDAAVVIIEFSDFECPYCARARETLDRFMQNRPEARLIYMQYPIPSLHPRAMLAAEASLEAHRQGKFWAYHDALFEHGQPLDRQALLRIGEEQGLEMAALRRALDRRAHRPRVEREIKIGAALGVTGTPTFFVNGYRMVGALPYETFVTVYHLLLRATRREQLAELGSVRPRVAGGR